MSDSKTGQPTDYRQSEGSGRPPIHSLQARGSPSPICLHQANDLISSIEPGQVEGSVPLMVPMPHIAGRVLHKELHHREVAFFGSQVQGQVPFIIFNVNISLELQQSLYSVQEACSGSIVNDSKTSSVFQIGISTSEKKSPGNLRISKFHNLQRSSPKSILSVDVYIILQQTSKLL